MKKQLHIEALESRLLLAGNVFQNPLLHTDVNNDGYLTGADAREVLAHVLTAARGDALDHIHSFVDIDGDFSLTLNDLRSVVSHLFMQAEGEFDFFRGELYDVAHDAGSALHGVIGEFGHVRSTLDSIYSDLELPVHRDLDLLSDLFDDEIGDLRHDLDRALGLGADAVADAIDDIGSELSSIRHILDHNFSVIVGGHLGNGSLIGHLHDALYQVGGYLNGIGDIGGGLGGHLYGVFHDLLASHEQELFDGLQSVLPHLGVHTIGSDPNATIAEILLSTDGGFDDNLFDYDLLNAGLNLTGLTGALDDPGETYTLFAPNDLAFVKLARDFGYHGYDETGAWDFLAAGFTELGAGDPVAPLTEVLLYHVVPGARLSAIDVLTASVLHQPIVTAQGGSFTPHFLTLQDNDSTLDDPTLFLPLQVGAENGTIHTLRGVLSPIEFSFEGDPMLP